MPNKQAPYASNKFVLEFADQTDLQAEKIEKAYIDGKESQKVNQFHYIPVTT